MAFKVIPATSSLEPDHAVLMGIASGLSELYSLPDHPSSVDEWLSLRTVELPFEDEQAIRCATMGSSTRSAPVRSTA